MTDDFQVYRDLQQRLDRLPASFPEVSSGLDIRLLKRLFTPAEARVATALSMKPEPLSRIHRRLQSQSISREELKTLLDGMAHKGTILASDTRYRERRYSNAIFAAGGIYNFQVDRLSPELIKDYWQYQTEARAKAAATTRKPGRRMLPLRTIPVEKSILASEKRQVGNYDDIRKIVENAAAKIAVANCICRQSNDLLGKSCQQTELRETCLLIGPDHAKRHVDMGIARYVTKEEALAILDRAQAAGLVLQPENSQRPDAICCCCGDCCVLFKQLKRAPRPADLYMTNYRIEFWPQLCTGCAACVEICQLDARAVVDGISPVNLDRCIGCGNCVAVCPTGANRLEKRPGPEVRLFRDKDEYYDEMLANRFGKRWMLLTKAKMLLGMRV
jgi:ferredoxin